MNANQIKAVAGAVAVTARILSARPGDHPIQLVSAARDAQAALVQDGNILVASAHLMACRRQAERDGQWALESRINVTIEDLTVFDPLTIR